VVPKFWLVCLIITGRPGSSSIMIGRRRRMAGIFLTRGGTRNPDSGIAVRKFIAAVSEAGRTVAAL
jgi:hypothetical protein